MSDPQAAPGPDVATLAIGILGGTGDQGRGLARRFALAGNPSGWIARNVSTVFRQQSLPL